MVKMNNDLIYLRSENARMHIKEISNYLNKSPQRLKYSIDVLEKEGIIKDPYCIFDYSYLGLLLFRVYFKGAYTSEKEKMRIIEELQKNPYIVLIYELSGEFDLTMEFASPNPSKFNKELKKLSEISKSLSDYKIVLNLVTHILPKYYLTNNESLLRLNIERVVGGDRPIESFTPHEMQVMKNLLIDPTIRLTKLAANSDLNIKTVKSVLNNLTKRRIIRGFKYGINKSKLGIYKFRLFLRLHNLTSEKEKKLMNYFLKTREIVKVSKTVGDWDLEVDIESMDRNYIRVIIMKLREEFIDIIEQFNQIEFFEYYKRTYLPKYLFS